MEEVIKRPDFAAIMARKDPADIPELIVYIRWLSGAYLRLAKESKALLAQVSAHIAVCKFGKRDSSSS